MFLQLSLLMNSTNTPLGSLPVLAFIVGKNLSKGLKMSDALNLLVRPGVSHGLLERSWLVEVGRPRAVQHNAHLLFIINLFLTHLLAFFLALIMK